jgi:hypothetical protein
MIAEANWGNFKAKFNGREEKAFESLCLLLFYKEHGRPTGALRYFNQPGIEAEPIIVGTEVIGMQAKFISSNISRYKTKLIDAIDDAKAQHPALTKVYFYLNLDFAKNTKDGYKDPAYKTEIEEHATTKGISITWKTKGFFETPFVCETNANIAQHYFVLGPSVEDFVRLLQGPPTFGHLRVNPSIYRTTILMASATKRHRDAGLGDVPDGATPKLVLRASRE